MAARTTEAQRRIMQAIRSKNTKPELIVRRLLYKMGYRYRLHKRGLPGSPDIVFGPRKKAIFVHGCFWHSHDSQTCPHGKKPRKNTHYWLPKLARTVERDRSNLSDLQKLGWEVLTVWECELNNTDVLRTRLLDFLEREESDDHVSTNSIAATRTFG